MKNLNLLLIVSVLLTTLNSCNSKATIQKENLKTLEQIKASSSFFDVFDLQFKRLDSLKYSILNLNKMDKSLNIGKWTAIVKKENQSLQIFVEGTFPTNGEKPLYELTKKTPRGINTSELVLTLDFGYLVTKDGAVLFSVNYKEAINTSETYKTVLVLDENGRKIANIDVLF